VVALRAGIHEVEAQRHRIAPLVPIIQNTLPGNVHAAVTLFWLLLGAFFWGLAYGVLGRLT
jgi:hypothetical protein